MTIYKRVKAGSMQPGSIIVHHWSDVGMQFILNVSNFPLSMPGFVNTVNVTVGPHYDLRFVGLHRDVGFKFLSKCRSFKFVGAGQVREHESSRAAGPPGRALDESIQ
jgi:hypothetical protein